MGCYRCGEDLSNYLLEGNVSCITNDSKDPLIRAIAEHLNVDMVSVCAPCLVELSKENNVRLISLLDETPNSNLKSKIKRYEIDRVKRVVSGTL